MIYMLENITIKTYLQKQSDPIGRKKAQYDQKRIATGDPIPKLQKFTLIWTKL